MFKENIACASWAEVVAIGLGVDCAKGINISNFIIKSDSTDIINRILKYDDITTIGYVLHNIKMKIKDCNSCSLRWCPCTCNKPIDRLSKLASANNCNFVFKMDYPSEIHNDLISDAY